MAGLVKNEKRTKRNIEKGAFKTREQMRRIPSGAKSSDQHKYSMKSGRDEIPVKFE